MDDAQLDSIEAREQAATPGPWRVDRVLVEGDAVIAVCYPQHIGIMRHPNWQADADFIAHARQDVPDLIAEVRRLRRALAAHAQLNQRLA